MTSPRALREFLVKLMPDLGRVARAGFENPGPIMYKRPGNPVTEIDREIEAAARAAIHDAWPGHDVQGEEAGVSTTEGDKPYRWYIDPIDGTMNFVRGIPIFSISIGVGHDRDMLAGAVMDPLRREVFHASAEDGAFLGDEPLRLGEATRLIDAAVSIQTSARGQFLNKDGFLLELHRQAQKTRKLGTIALELAYVAAGRLDLLIAGKASPQNWWDIAGGWTLVEAAGGRVVDLDGNPLTEESTHLVAGAESIVDELLTLFHSQG